MRQGKNCLFHTTFFCEDKRSKIAGFCLFNLTKSKMNLSKQMNQHCQCKFDIFIENFEQHFDTFWILTLPLQ